MDDGDVGGSFKPQFWFSANWTGPPKAILSDHTFWVLRFSALPNREEKETHVTWTAQYCTVRCPRYEVYEVHQLTRDHGVYDVWNVCLHCGAYLLRWGGGHIFSCWKVNIAVKSAMTCHKISDNSHTTCCHFVLTCHVILHVYTHLSVWATVAN